MGGIIHGEGGVEFHPAMYYRYANETMRNGMSVFAYQLTDVEEGDGVSQDSSTLLLMVLHNVKSG
jgi:hypothetical protein